MKRFLLLLLLGSQPIFAQDLHFSQTSQTPLLINPGAAGVFDGWERVNLNHRNQWLGAATQFMTTSIAGDVNFFKSRNNSNAYIGLGAMFFNDVGGDASFGIQNGSITISGVIPTPTGHTFSLGIQSGFGNRKGNMEKLRFENQWNGQEFDADILSGEAGSLNSFAYFDASAGFYYVYDAGQSTFSRNNDFKLQLGLSAYHINQPALRYVGGGDDKLYRKYVAQAAILSDIQDSRLAIDASALQFIQGPHFETLLGLMLRYRFQDGTKISALRQDAFFGFGMYARLKDAIIPSIMVQYNSFRFGISYDITVSALRKAASGGSLEFSLSYTNLDHALFKRRRGY